MELLKIPAKYSQCGIKVKCLKCKWQLKDSCKMTGKKLHSCEHKDKHRFNLVVCIPNSGNARRMKIIETRDFNVALEEMRLFRQELQVDGYDKNTNEVEVSLPTYLNYAADYLDCLNGVNTPLHLIRMRSAGHIRDNKRVLLLFGQVLKDAGYRIESLQLKDIGDKHVEVFYKHLIDVLKLGNATKNKYMVIMKTFFNWCIEVKDHTGKNPFGKSELTFEKQEKEIFTKAEFDQLLKAVTYENGRSQKYGKKRNYYRPWLVNAYKLSLEVGERAESVVELNWKNLIELENGVEVFRISNLKPNRIKSGKDKGRFIRYIPVTNSLKRLLIDLGYEKKKGTDCPVLDTGAEESVRYIMQLITRSFSHFVEKAGIRSLCLKDLRKTYISHLTGALGEKARIFTGHSDTKVIEDHYLSKSFLAGKLGDLKIFDE